MVSAVENTMADLTVLLRNVQNLGLSDEKVRAVALIQFILKHCIEMLQGATSEEDRSIFIRKINACRAELMDILPPTPKMNDNTDEVSVAEVSNLPKQMLEEPDLSSYSMKNIVGMGAAIRALFETVTIPFMMEGAFNSRMRFIGVLLFGPSGVGKSLVARTLVRETTQRYGIPIRYFDVKLNSVVGSLLGQTEQNLTNLFDEAVKCQPSVIVIDEMDSLMRKRTTDEKECYRNIKNHLLRLMDELANNTKVVIIGTTNKIEELDDAFKRRFGRRVYVALPTKLERMEILQMELTSIHGVQLHEIDLNEIAEKTFQFSPADLKNVVQVAYHSSHWHGLLDDLVTNNKKGIDVKSISLGITRNITQHDLLRAALTMRPSNDAKLIDEMEEFAVKHATDRDAPYQSNTSSRHPLDCREFKRKPLKALLYCFICCCGNVKR